MPDIPKKMRLGDLLVNNKIITQEQLEKALKYQQKHSVRLGEALVSLKVISEDKLLSVLRYHLKIPLVDLRKFPISKKIIELVPLDIAKRCRAIPVKTDESPGKKTLFIAMSNPLDLDAIKDIEFASGFRVQPLLTKETDILAALSHYYNIDFELEYPDVADLKIDKLLDDMSISLEGDKFEIRGTPDRSSRESSGNVKKVEREYIREMQKVTPDKRKISEKDFEESYYTTLKKERIVIRAILNLMLKKNIISKKELDDEIKEVEREF